MDKIKIQKKDFGKIAIDFIIAILLSFKILNYSLVSINNNSRDGYLNILFLTIGILFLMVYLFELLKKNKKTVNISLIGTFFFIVVLLLYIVFYKKSDVSIYEMIIYFMLSFLLGLNNNQNVEEIIVYVMVISLIPLTCFNKLFDIQWYGSVTMDISYAFLPTIIASILHFNYFFKEKKNKVIYVVLYVINIFYFFEILLYGERGTVICIFVALLLCWIIKYKDGKILKKNLSFKFFIMISLGILFLLFYKDILEFIVEITKIDSYSINKFITLAENDVSNGRFTIYGLGLKGFINSPIWGNGISSFNYYYASLDYPHNILIQLLFDGGIILFVLFTYIFIKGTLNVYKSNDIEKISFWIYLFSSSFIYLFFSNNIWNVPAIWIFMGFLTLHASEKNKES